MKIDKQTVLDSLPPEWPQDLLPEIQAEVRRLNRKVVALDDDPTGTQTVHDVTVLTAWLVEALRTELGDPAPVLYLLTNSRSFPQAEAQGMNREIAAHLQTASRQAGREFVVVSRSDSTLRGHYPGEVQALAEGLGGGFDGTVLAPFFLEGGRYTLADVHYVAEGEALIPAGETEYARDATFGYRSSNLRDWVAEKWASTPGAEAAIPPVVSIGLDLLRQEGPDAVRRRLMEVSGGAVVIVNAASYRDLEVFVLGLLQAETAGKRFLYRTAASFVRVRGGLEPGTPLAVEDLARALRAGAAAGQAQGGLIVAGSYIHKSGRQIVAVQALAGVESVEVQVAALLDSEKRAPEIARAAWEASQALKAGRDALVYTSRRLVTGSDQAESLRIGRSVSSALVEIVRGLAIRPAWVIAKGGITSSDTATLGLDVLRARVLGQAIPGVPAWQTGPESRWPGLVYVVFPGNVGGPEAIAEMVTLLRGR